MPTPCRTCGYIIASFAHQEQVHASSSCSSLDCMGDWKVFRLPIKPDLGSLATNRVFSGQTEFRIQKRPWLSFWPKEGNTRHSSVLSAVKRRKQDSSCHSLLHTLHHFSESCWQKVRRGKPPIPAVEYHTGSWTLDDQFLSGSMAMSSS